MVHGIATDSKKYKHRHRNNEKWLCEDLHVFRKNVEKYVNNLRSNDEEEINISVQKSRKKIMTIDRIIAILFLGIFGSITLITGMCLIIKENFIIGVPLGLIGVVFVVTFYLYEKYR